LDFGTGHCIEAVCVHIDVEELRKWSAIFPLIYSVDKVRIRFAE